MYGSETRWRPSSSPCSVGSLAARARNIFWLALTCVELLELGVHEGVPKRDLLRIAERQSGLLHDEAVVVLVIAPTEILLQAERLLEDVLADVLEAFVEVGLALLSPHDLGLALRVREPSADTPLLLPGHADPARSDLARRRGELVHRDVM